MADSILKNGFINPVLYWQHNDHRYIIDGVCRVMALRELMEQKKYPAYYFDIKKGMVPGLLIDCKKDKIKEMVLSSHGSFGIMTEKSLKAWVGKAPIKLHDYGFAEGTLIDFYHDNLDITPFFTDVKRVAKTNTKLGDLLN
jgi:hypothetical protein